MITGTPLRCLLPLCGYNGGFVLPCAIGAETRIAWGRRADSSVRVVAFDFGCETDSFALDGTIPRHPLGGWRDYVRGMVETLPVEGVPLAGADLAVAGDIPLGAGLSSSASLEVAVGRAMLADSGRTQSLKGSAGKRRWAR